ncbi:Hypothetical protein A7982_04661 [Minicystis rosea]|nr:Hypothetical protein A7982_04661 [Minicystis rosea]
MPQAARISDLHICQAHSAPVPIVTGARTVKIGFMPAARVTDTCACPPRAEIVEGSSNVFIEGEEAARLGDETNPKGVVVTGFPTVFIGSTPEVDALFDAAKTGVPFLDCQTCRMARTTETNER